MEKELTCKSSFRFYINLIAQDTDPPCRLRSWSSTSFCFFRSQKGLFEQTMFSFSKTNAISSKFLKKEISVSLPWKLLYFTVLRLDKKQGGTDLKLQSSSQRCMQGSSPWMVSKIEKNSSELKFFYKQVHNAKGIYLRKMKWLQHWQTLEQFRQWSNGMIFKFHTQLQMCQAIKYWKSIFLYICDEERLCQATRWDHRKGKMRRHQYCIFRHSTF